jgi:hypothetical protein
MGGKARSKQSLPVPHPFGSFIAELVGKHELSWREFKRSEATLSVVSRPFSRVYLLGWLSRHLGELS